MNHYKAAFWMETLKARRSKVSWGASLGFLILPLVGGLFMIILKNPEQAQALGIISVKAQLVGGSADWPTFFDILLQGMAIGGSIVFAFIVAWVFGREFSDHTIKELLAIPTSRETIVGAKFTLTALWMLGLTIVIFVVGVAVGTAVDIPGWSSNLAWTTLASMLIIAVLLFMLMPLVALFATAGRGYLPALGWAIATLVFAQIAAVLGWGDWVPWSVPMMISGMAGPGTEQVGLHGYATVLFVFVSGLALTFGWWRHADQAQ
jgi:ABC-2 type transport system permease protein